MVANKQADKSGATAEQGKRGFRIKKGTSNHTKFTERGEQARNSFVYKNRDSIQASVSGIRQPDRASLYTALLDGLSYAAIKNLSDALLESPLVIGNLLGIPSTTLKRREKAGRFTEAESDRLLRFARILDLATAMTLGDSDAALIWLKTPADLFGGETPLQHARTEFGTSEVEDLIGRIRHGVYS